MKPYFYSDKNLDVPYINKTKKEAIALSNFQKKVFYKYEFNTRKELVLYRSDDTFEDNIPFWIRCKLDFPDIYTKYKHTNELKFMFLDIEQYTKPGDLFPTYDDRILSIAWCGNDKKIKSVYLKKDNTSDKKLLLKFIDEFQKVDPDVIVGYNVKKYDITTILYRCIRNKINTSLLSKDNINPYIGGKEVVTINGRVIYDVYTSVARDQSLSGNVPNKGLKSVSNYFGFKEERKPVEPKNISKLQGTKELILYNRDDVERLLLLFGIYWDGIFYTANDLEIPLNTALNLNITDLSLITIGSEFIKRGIIGDGSNSVRYPQIFSKKRANYEGALVDIFRTGVFNSVYKIDYGSMYPSIMSSFNLSPDTTSLLMFEALGEFRIEEEDNWFEYHIPDKVIGETMVIQVLKKQGFCSELVSKFLKERAEYKRKWKETGEKKYRSMSDIRKVKANGTYGVQGSSHHAFGFAPIAIATTGIGRECAQLLIDLLEELYPKSVIEIDTDGVYFYTSKIDEEKILKLFDERIKEKFKKDLDLSVDIDEYHSGYFYKMKNYVLKTKDNKMIYHGAAMKASSKNLLSKNLIKELAEARLSGLPTDTIVSMYQKLDFPLKYFAMNVTMGMHMRQYKSENALAPRLARQAQTHLGMKPAIGNQYHYIKGNSGYVLYDLAKKEELDMSYYLDQVNGIIEMFDVKPIMSSLNKWI